MQGRPTPLSADKLQLVWPVAWTVPPDSPRSASSAASPGAPRGPRQPHQTVSGPGREKGRHDQSEADAAITGLYQRTSGCPLYASDSSDSCFTD